MLLRFNNPAKGASDMIMRFKMDRKSGVIVVVWDFGGQKVRHSRYVYSEQISNFHGDDDLVFYYDQNNYATLLMTGLPRHAQCAAEPTRHVRSTFLRAEVAGQAHAPDG